jgi:diguanylate cyclase (GGDEF)-like protein
MRGPAVSTLWRSPWTLWTGPDRAARKAERDALTGLYNRSWLERAAATLPATGGAVLLCDIDREERGDMPDDAAIERLTMLLRRTRRIAARLDGTTFALLLPRRSALQAERLATLMRGRFRHRAGHRILTLSIGIATYSADEPAGEAVERADFALFRARETGPNRTIVFGRTPGSGGVPLAA